MANGKGSNRRQFDKKLELAYKAGHTETFGERKKVDGRKTKIVIRQGQLIRPGEMTADGKVFSIPIPPDDYTVEVENLHRQVLSKFMSSVSIGSRELK